jgi:hypothetical protein
MCCTSHVTILASVISMSRASSDEIAAATARRNEIVNALLEVLTGPAFTTRELQHYRFVGEIFQVNSVVQELCSSASSLEGRTELSLSVALAALAIAIDDTPPSPTERVLKRREADKERREADKQFRASLAGKVKPAGAVKPAVSKRPLSQESSAVAHRKRRASMSEEELNAFRALATQRQRDRRARLKASQSSI